MENRHYLLIGGNSGIGAATATRLAAEGHSLTVALRDPNKLTASPSIQTIPFSTSAGIEGTLPDALDGLVYFPGTIKLQPFHRVSLEDLQEELETNVLGAFRVIQQALPALKKSERASIVLFSTVAVAKGMGFHAGIATAKGALEGLGRSLAAELAPKIRVNMIAPSLTDTPLAAPLIGTEEKRAAAEKRHPLKQIGAPEDTAALVEFLLGDQTRFMTGQVLRPDGGLSSIWS